MTAPPFRSSLFLSEMTELPPLKEVYIAPPPPPVEPAPVATPTATRYQGDRKSTRLNSSHLGISYAVFCLKKKNTLIINIPKVLRYPGASGAVSSACRR